MCMAKAAVYYFDQDTTSWQPADMGISQVYIYFDPANFSYRVVGISQADAKVSFSTLQWFDVCSVALTLGGVGCHQLAGLQRTPLPEAFGDLPQLERQRISLWIELCFSCRC